MEKHTNDDNQLNKFSDHEENFCPVHTTIHVFAGKWKMKILYLLRNGKLRFGELKEAIPGITQAMLSNQLRNLVNDGMVHRKLYAEIPPKVEYSLTEMGRSLIPVIISMERWGIEYLKSKKEYRDTGCFWDEENQQVSG